MDDSDDEMGPSPIESNTNNEPSSSSHAQKKRRLLAFEDLYLQSLPSSSYYEKSYMHRDFITHISIARSTDFLITGSIDGHVKLWKKMSSGIEFVKHFLAHIGKLHDMIVSPDGLKLATSGADGMLKVFDIAAFDMANMILTTSSSSSSSSSSDNFLPGACCWLTEGTAHLI